MSITQKIPPPMAAKQKNVRTVLRVHNNAFSVNAEKFGKSSPVVRRIGTTSLS